MERGEGLVRLSNEGEVGTDPADDDDAGQDQGAGADDVAEDAEDEAEDEHGDEGVQLGLLGGDQEDHGPRTLYLGGVP